MSSLNKLQNAFMHAVYEGDNEILPFLKPNEKLTVDQRLAIYRGSVYGSLCNAIEAVYPVVAKIVGKEFFDALALHYVKTHPSHSVNLHLYGEEFADFIATFPPLAELAYCADVARLEWAYHTIFYAEDELAFDFEAFTALAPEAQEKLRFHLSSACKLLSSPYPIHRIWGINQTDYEGEDTVDLAEGAVYLCILRFQNEMQLHPLTKDEWFFLQAIQSPLPFAQSCQQLLTDYPELDIAPLLPQCVQKGYINSYSFD